MRLALRLTAAAVLAASTLAAHADTFQYKIINFGDTVVFDESAILQGDTTISSFISFYQLLSHFSRNRPHFGFLCRW